jgi:hypothetical protein
MQQKMKQCSGRQTVILHICMQNVNKSSGKLHFKYNVYTTERECVISADPK